MFATAETASIYTRAQGIADGCLVDITATAREAGFKVPVAMTDGVAELVDATATANGQSTRGRLWDVLWMAWLAARRSKSDRLTYEVHFAPRTGEEHEQTSALVLHIGPGDAGEPVITIMLPGED